jgi:hypothetical protein
MSHFFTKYVWQTSNDKAGGLTPTRTHYIACKWFSSKTLQFFFKKTTEALTLCIYHIKCSNTFKTCLKNV